jgi:hypothetical protein
VMLKGIHAGASRAGGIKTAGDIDLGVQAEALLLGESFLKRLVSVEQCANTLILRQ